MRILQALKKIKHLDRKKEKNVKRIKRWCSYLTSDGEPPYDLAGITNLIKSANDLIVERNRLRHQIHKTNATVTVEFQGQEMTIDELIILRTLTLTSKIEVQKAMRRKEKNYGHEKDDKVIMQYDPMLRDKKIDSLECVMDEVDALLDHVNISTELIE